MFLVLVGGGGHGVINENYNSMSRLENKLLWKAMVWKGFNVYTQQKQVK